MEWVGEAEEMVSGDNFIACGSTKKDHALDFKWMRAQTLDANAFHRVCSVFSGYIWKLYLHDQDGQRTCFCSIFVSYFLSSVFPHLLLIDHVSALLLNVRIFQILLIKYRTLAQEEIVHTALLAKIT